MNEKLEIWKERFIEAEQEYSARLASFDAWTKQYRGDREIVTDGRRGKNGAILKSSQSSRKIGVRRGDESGRLKAMNGRGQWAEGSARRSVGRGRRLVGSG